MKPFRCYNPAHDRGGLGEDFWAADGACPACGASPTHTNPRVAALVLPLEVIHFDPPSDFPHIGLGHAACNARLRLRAVLLSGEPRAVNCPACRESGVFRAVASAGGGGLAPAEDFAVEADPYSGVIRRLNAEKPNAEPRPAPPPCCGH